MKLSKRLSLLTTFVGKGTTSIWDIGCDHGLLGTSFLERKEITEINLVDPSALVIETLKKNLLDSYITIPEKIQIHDKKGQDIRLGPEQKTIFIAGMGGKEVIAIMERLLPQMTRSDVLVISPHKNFLMVREWLKNSELRLYDERVVLEDGRFYPILSLIKDQSLPIVSSYGERIWQGEEGEAYLRQEFAVHGRHQDKASLDYVAFLKDFIPLN